MKTKEKAKDLINSYRMILMNEDTDCGNEILCTSISKQCALIAVDEILNNYYKNHFQTGKKIDYWLEVKQEIKKL